ncbi:MAG: hypothetical protein EBT03_09875 [Betaproteobacteria bacterium]|nr:hypothetical protein [Betaproteobacteria bacterium]NCA17425.1 hypothetical protein [Betaproteobacteria bacterium]
MLNASVLEAALKVNLRGTLHGALPNANNVDGFKVLDGVIDALAKSISQEVVKHITTFAEVNGALISTLPAVTGAPPLPVGLVVSGTPIVLPPSSIK